jgi:hypothetical protein
VSSDPDGVQPEWGYYTSHKGRHATVFSPVHYLVPSLALHIKFCLDFVCGIFEHFLFSSLQILISVGLALGA